MGRARASRHRFSDGWISGHWLTLRVDVLTWPRELARSIKRVSEQVRLALRIQDPDTVVGLEGWNAANLSLVFHDFFRPSSTTAWMTA